mgnify:CR=1 FL=1
MIYKYYIMDDLGYTYEVKSFEGINKVDPKDVAELAHHMVDEKGEYINVEEVQKRTYINDIMISMVVYMKGDCF